MIYRVPQDIVWFTCNFQIGTDNYTAEFRKLSTSGKYIFTVRNEEDVEIFKNLYVADGVNYAGIFAEFGENKTLRFFSDGKYIETEG